MSLALVITVSYHLIQFSIIHPYQSKTDTLCGNAWSDHTLIHAGLPFIISTQSRILDRWWRKSESVVGTDNIGICCCNGETKKTPKRYWRVASIPSAISCQVERYLLISLIMELSQKHYLFSHRSSRPRSVISMAESRASTVKSGRSAKSKVIITSVPNPFCPKIKGMCCLMLLLNLGLILVTLGLVIVVQFFEPIFVWWVIRYIMISDINFFFSQDPRNNLPRLWFRHNFRVYHLLCDALS